MHKLNSEASGSDGAMSFSGVSLPSITVPAPFSSILGVLKASRPSGSLRSFTAKREQSESLLRQMDANTTLVFFLLSAGLHHFILLCINFSYRADLVVLVSVPAHTLL